MELTEQKKENHVVIGIHGRLDTTNYSQLEKKLMDLIDSGSNRILVDCKNMDYVSSSGLRVFLMALKKITQAGGKFMLCSLQENIREIFEISGFSSIFEICSETDEAAAAFAK
jgi:anti-anti-sigma factor